MVDQLVATTVERQFTPPHRQGSVLITLLNQDPYTLWGLPSLAQRPPSVCPGTRLPQPRYRLLRSFKFHHELYEGYAHRRTIGFKEGKSKADNEEITGRQGEARTWEFVKAIETEKADKGDKEGDRD
jgi:25S rRNA (uracil2634-N3)-methyltransferase